MTDNNRAHHHLAELLRKAAHGLNEIAEYLQAAADIITIIAPPAAPAPPPHLQKDERPGDCECGRPIGHGA